METFRFCAYHRRLNAVTVKVPYPLSCMTDYFDTLGAAQLFLLLTAM